MIDLFREAMFWSLCMVLVIGLSSAMFIVADVAVDWLRHRREPKLKHVDDCRYKVDE